MVLWGQEGVLTPSCMTQHVSFPEVNCTAEQQPNTSTAQNEVESFHKYKFQELAPFLTH